MQALFKLRQGEDGMALMETREPLAGLGQIKIKVYASGICGTDIHVMKDEFPCDYPVIMGHEYSGVITEVAEDVAGFKPGDRVISMSRVVTCGQCRYCQEGINMLCPKGKSIGFAINGAFAEYIAVPAKFAFKVPNNVSLDEAALCEPLACAVHAILDRGKTTAGDQVLVSGPGVIGILIAQVALAAGATVTITGTKVDKDRLEYANSIGCHTVMVDQEDSAEWYTKITAGQGFDIVVECAGVPSSADLCLQSVRKGGTYVQTGLFQKKIEFDFNLGVIKEISIIFEYGHQWKSWDLAIMLLKNKQIDLKPLVSGKFALSDWQKGFDMVLAKQGFKVLLMP